MTTYIIQGRYPREAIEGMINKPEDRAVAVAALAKSVGGKLLDYYVTFGESDFLVIIESGRGKSETDIMAALFAAAAAGGVADLKTTVAVRSKDAMKAMRGAKKILKSFQSAGQAG
ncbi:MAG: GYD domain-containing protein [Alphaproteobacteria bacterium]|jgi:uncharacterized protein with GYD domain